MGDAPAGGRWWIIPAGVLIACLYLPTLGIPFDFQEDGCLVYSRPGYASTLAGALPESLSFSAEEYRLRGPFRPVLWAHWFVSAALHDGPMGFRVERLLVCALAACAMMLLLTEMGVAPAASVCAAALACWSGYRSEVWRQLGMPEALGMPYALLSLWCAVRASRRGASVWWDVAAGALFLAALGIKNTYLALAPALVWLRLCGEGFPTLAGVCRVWHRLAFYAVPAALPVVQMLLLKLRPAHPDFQTRFRLANGIEMAAAVRDAMNPWRMGVAFGLLLLAVLFVALYGRREERAGARPPTAALGAAALLFFAGVVIYMPWPYRAGRYTMPAAWGADILFAVLLTAVSSARPWIRLPVYAAVFAGLILVGLGTLELQRRQAEQLCPMWDALRYLEEQTPGSAAMRTGGAEEYSEPERIHFASHLTFRGRSRLPGMPALAGGMAPDVVVTRSEFPPAEGYSLVRRFERGRGGACHIWMKGRAG